LTTIRNVAALEFRRMFNNPQDPNPCFLEIQAGAGGTEAQDWASMLLRMYVTLLRAQGLRCRGDGRIRRGCGGHQERHHQGHRRIRLRHVAHRNRHPPAGAQEPFDSGARRHTSFSSVFVYPEADDSIEIDINPADLRVDTFRASGAGGQHINKTDSAIRITHMPSGIVVQCQSDRSQHRNRAEAMAMLKSRLYEAELRKRQSEQQALEDSKTDIGWGHQIRSYVLDQSRIKDLRTSYEVGNTQAVLDGDLDGFIQASLKQGVAKIGSLPIPAALLEFALATGVRLAGYEREWNLARHAIRELKFEPQRQRVIVSYVWEPALLERARSVAVSRDDLARMRSAQEMLAAMLDHKAAGSRTTLPAILGPMLDVNGSDQRENRRAAIFVLAAYLSEKNIAAFIPEAAKWPRIRPVTLTLLGREDSAQHFVISAALAAWAGEPIADAIGIYKELTDARHGSGFSFADLAADRAGTRFGELLNRGDPKLQALLQGKFSEHDLIPSLDALPESINERTFRRQFSNPGSPAYQKLAEEIERRLAAMPLYQAKSP
jgi:peptide chain release factor 2